MTGQKYKDGVIYTFKFGNVSVEAVFEGLTAEVIERFNRICAEEKIRAYHTKGEQEQ